MSMYYHILMSKMKTRFTV